MKMVGGIVLGLAALTMIWFAWLVHSHPDGR
jgi:hypothetical protein